MIAMLVCFAGMIASYDIGYTVGFVINAIAFFLLLARWVYTYIT